MSVKKVENFSEEAAELKNQLKKLEEELGRLKQQEVNLQKKEKLWLLVLEHIRDGIIFSDEKGHFLLFNPQMEKLTGYSEEEANRAGDFSKLIYPEKEEYQLAMNRLEELKKNKEISEVETRIRHKNGHFIDVLIVSSLLEVENEKLFISLFHDITKRKQAERELLEYKNHLEEIVQERTNTLETLNQQLIGEISSKSSLMDDLKKSEERFRLLVNSMDDIVFEVDQQLMLKGLYGRWFERKGIDFASFIGCSIDKLNEIENLIHKPICEIVLKGESGIYETNLVADNGLRNFQVSVSPLKDQNGKIIGLVGVGRDITDRKRLERAVMESEARYRRLIETMNDGLVQINEFNQLVYVNNHFCKMLGYSEDELIGENIEKFIPADSLTIFSQQTDKQNLGNRKPYEIRLIRKDGSEIIARISPTPLLDDNNIFQGSFAIVTDITEIKLASIIAQANEIRLNAMINSFNGYMYITDQNYELKFINDKLQQEKKIKSLTEKKCYQAVFNQTSPCEWCDLERVLSGKSANAEVFSAQEQRWFYLSSAPLINAEKGVEKQSLLIDITTNKLIEQDLIISEEKFRSLFEYAPVSLWEEDFSELKTKLEILKQANVTDLKAYLKKNPQRLPELLSSIKINDINQQTLKLYGFKDKSILGESIIQVVNENAIETFIDGIAALYEGRKSFASETENLNANGEVMKVYLSMHVPESYEKDWKKVYVSIIDITKLKEAEEGLKNLVREKEILLKEINHRVKNNLQIIASLLGMSEKRAKNQETKEFLAALREKVYAIALIHNQLYQNIASGEIDMQYYISQLLSYLMQLYSRKSRPIKFSMQCKNTFLNVTQTVSLALILHELVTNACKHAFSGKSSGKIDIFLNRNPDNQYILVVQDNGAGISKQGIVDSSEQIGLKLVRTLVEKQLKGSLEIFSGNGTKFVITFKKDKGEEQ